MSAFVYEAAIYLIEALISGIFLLNILDEKHRKWIHLTVWCVIVMIMLMVTPSFSFIRIVALNILELGYTCLFFQNRFLRKLKHFMLKEVIMVLAASISYGMYCAITDKSVPFFAVCKSENCTYCLLYLLMLSVLTSFVLQFIKERRGIELLWVGGTLVVVGAGEAMAVLAVAHTAAGMIDSRESWLVIIAMICMVIANVSIGMLAPYLLGKVTMLNSMDYGKELSNMEFRYYEMSVENEKKLQDIRHDISNHIQTIYALLSNDQKQLGMEMINELKFRYAQADQIVYCNNPVVNIILSNKKNEAESYQIETHIKVLNDLKNLNITDFDLSTVICNLLDNAIQGCLNSEQPHPRLVIEIMQKNQYLVIRVLNSCKVTMNIDGTDRIETNKSSSQAHGLGMPIIAGIASHYRGDFVVTAQAGMFTATVVLSMKCKD